MLVYNVCIQTTSSLRCFVKKFVCLFMLMLNVPVNNFSVMSGRSHRFLGITSTFRAVNASCSWHNTAEVGIEPRLTSRSGVRDSTTRPPHFPFVKKYMHVSFHSMENSKL